MSGALEIVARTDPGLVREHNEDAVFANPVRGLAILADGMGGYNAGEVASSMAVSLLATRIVDIRDDAEAQDFDPAGQRIAHRQLRERIEEANAEIYFASQNEPQLAGMGTTLVVAWFYDNHLTVAHLGDSRLYRLRGGRLERLTRDHSLLQEQLDSGMISAEQARVSRRRNLVTRALGVELRVSPELRDFEVQAGDLYLLCSDGLSDMVEDTAIRRTLLVSRTAAEAADSLVEQALDNGGHDNVTVLCVFVYGRGGAGLRSRLARWRARLNGGQA